MTKKAVLVITDGIGYCSKTEYNAFYHATKPTYDKLFSNTPHSLIDTYGLSVGLPEGQMGNSEVGHMSIGSGRILYQDLVKISLALSENRFKDNEEFKNLLDKSDRLHIIGLMSDGGVHSHIDQFMGIADIAAKEGKEVFLHLITDGRDVSPTSAQRYIKQVELHLNENVKIATISGRFYAMDRDNRWERVERAYEAIINATPKTDYEPSGYIGSSYALGDTDEFVAPVAFEGYDGMRDGDSVLTINFRSDRMREMVTAIADKNFSWFSRVHVDVNLATITEYDKSFSYPVLFKKDAPQNTLSEIISKAGLRQLHTAETEKYAHVTFFFNGGIDEPYENETRVLIPSPNVKTYDEKPEMSAKKVGDVVLKAMDDEFDFVVVNFANGDMVGHTGNFEAAKKAVTAVDSELGKILQKAKEMDYAVVITSDHGNCEEMRDNDGNILTNHTVGKVWCFVEADGVSKVENGGLNHIAPTVLKLMNIEVPSEMDHSLI
ncbi:MAG: phosphoglycerate mutase (2,3-diphosphoglycerate-independent) [Sulfurimonas sp. RIFOXYD12_FULL_33_39]|uniref:2,3-bisphosphoglycerate-independent phosphoglycerate mutase n=1 Tax=unclassified Sulfurimonas TaxID=2623549 RepID=UPI0008D0805C|nr:MULTISPECIES: 2,3-bisphosphoglycerate-independent phosphoglycerate mutase [unclassified Sulfurimonas]OHE08712.1 MAG: phosphoglycerate mutase (2,3-diphosphoglycerate-independent) [Sulfurimonas sp. RIFOXYD12_FULL_33_39]OHE13997.1 MAG: phosphoglycerate mutase (2,3-diphosphoglycerate-independent) [Sulfurimonas sp. RIFOXYD2_FULL_34_21]